MLKKSTTNLLKKQPFFYTKIEFGEFFKFLPLFIYFSFDKFDSYKLTVGN